MKTKHKAKSNKNWKVLKGSPEEVSEQLEDYIEDVNEEKKSKKKDKRAKNGKPKKKATKVSEPETIPTFRTTNPYGANQFLLDPRQLKCWEFYVDIKNEETFSNAYRSALKAGYTEQTSLRITDENWFTEKLRRHNLYSKGVKVLDETLDTDHIEKKVGAFGYIVDPVKKTYVYGVNPAILGIKNKAAMFVTERLGKDDGFSTRNELTGKDGKDLPIPILGGLPEAKIEKVNNSD